MSAWLRREPVLNGRKAVVAARIAIHAESVGAAVALLNELAPLWPAASDSLVTLPGLVPDDTLLMWQRPAGAMFEFPAPEFAGSSGQALANRLDAAGITLCLGGFVPDTALAPSPRFRYVLADARTMPRAERAPGLPLATGLADNAAFDAATDNGYEGAAGWFFLHGLPPSAGRLNPAHAGIIHILNLVRQNADLAAVETALKQDIGISFKLLRYINSAGFGLAKKIESFRHAVTLIGYGKLNKWLSLLLVTASRDPAATALMQTAIARGRFMEIAAAGSFDKEQLDNLFIAGSFSLLDVLLGSRLDTVLAQMNLPEPIADALLHGSGSCAPWLELARACEQDDIAALVRQATALGLDAAAVNRAQIEALAFADSLQVE